MRYSKITDQDFRQKILSEQHFSVLVFGTEWSGSSEIMDSMMERLSEEFTKNIQFFKVDIEQQKSISEFFNVFSIPTTLIIKDGEVVDLIRGLIPASKIRKKLNKYLNYTTEK